MKLIYRYVHSNTLALCALRKLKIHYRMDIFKLKYSSI